MKNYLLVLVSIFTLSLTTANAQDEITAKATFDGFNGETYSFTTIDKEKKEVKTIEFSDISAEILKTFDLKAETYKDKHFFITYVVKTKTSINGDEEDDVEVYTLKTIRQVAY